MTPLELRGVQKRLGRRVVLDALDLSLEPGRVTVLLGRNGEGKTTLLRLAFGLLRPSRGTVRTLGTDPIARGGRIRERIGFVPDHPDVDPRMSPRDLARLVAPFHPGFDPSEAARLLATFGVAERAAFKTLSRGQSMKALLAVALAHDPELLLLDELFAGLDPISADEVLRALLEEGTRERRTVLLTTHDLEVASRIADDVAFLEGGRITKHVPLEALEGAHGGPPAALKAALAGPTA